MRRYVQPTQQLVLEIFVRDLARAKGFYESLGFELHSEKPGFATLTWEDHYLFLDEQGDTVLRLEKPQANVRVMVSDVDACWERARSLGAPVVQPIGDRGYGLRDFTICDPDGFGVRFGSWLGDKKEDLA